MQETLKLIREIILNVAKKYNIDVDRIILFGSRARGDYRENSDWDILIVTKEKLDKKVLEEFILTLIRDLAKKETDLHPIVVSKQAYEKYRKYLGTIEGFATIEGIVI